MGKSFTASSPPLTTDASRRSELSRGIGAAGGATYGITEECERLFCDTMRAVFLGEGKAARNGSVVMGTNWRGDTARSSHGVHEESSSSGLRQAKGKFSVVQHWLEVWDYIGGARFRSFVVDHDAGGEREMFVFFEGSAIVADLRPGWGLSIMSGHRRGRK